MLRAICASLVVGSLTGLSAPVHAAEEGGAASAMPAPREATPTTPAAGPSPTGESGAILPHADVSDEGEPVRPTDLSYGVALVGRWVSVPGWLLDAFTTRNVPLSSYATGVQVFRRKGNFQIGVDFIYQDMSPSDGNWLGKDHSAATDTYYTQFRGLALYALNASFVWNTTFTNWFGVHYGAGVGFAIVGGEILRTRNSPMVCTAANAGNPAECYPISASGPVNCAGGVCNEQQLQGLGPGPDNFDDPHRFKDGNVPPVVPIVDVVVGVDFRIPNVRGWEAKIEGGFYDAFFLGGGVAYTF